jgi:hypothetical protein
MVNAMYKVKRHHISAKILPNLKKVAPNCVEIIAGLDPSGIFGISAIKGT